MNHLSPMDLAALFDSLDTGLIVLDSDARDLDWNNWMAGRTDIAAEAARGRRLENIWPAAAADLIIAVARCLKSGTASALHQPPLQPGFAFSLPPAPSTFRTILVRPLGEEPRRCLIQITETADPAPPSSRLPTISPDSKADGDERGDAQAILTFDRKDKIHFASPADRPDSVWDPGNRTDATVSRLRGSDPLHFVNFRRQIGVGVGLYQKLDAGVLPALHHDGVADIATGV